MALKHKTPMLEELEKGPWPSFVADIRRMAARKPMCEDLLGLLELSYEQKEGHWKHGGIVGVFGYGGGVIGRYCDRPDLFPNVAHFHTLRVNQPASKFYSTEQLRKICDMWEEKGSGLTNMHGSTGDMVLLGTTTDQLEPVFYHLTHELGMDLGGSGSNLRTPSCCIGKARCEWSCLDTQEITYDLTMTYQDELHRPMFPYKFKFKTSGCPNDCVAAIARADCSIIGTWRDKIRIDQEAVRAYAAGELVPNGGSHGTAKRALDIQKEVVDLCPTGCMEWDGKTLKIWDEDCTRCMHCINVMPRALRPGQDTGATILFGAKAPILEGAQLSSVVIPFMKMEPPYDEFKELIEKVWDWWMENGKNRERLGELIQRFGMKAFLEAIEVQPDPRMIKTPRYNPYIFYDPADVPGGWEHDPKAFRERHHA
ncbi:dissimilatory sulfite reductase alpha subunit [Desulfacinum hydrothermale DSM 13146]|uniref:Dissimilatory sulfite reductase alpha subunit n=1 Tax=Desulfacinum hydrothermale DSM 13146 TaxID=1121390 RepID=A0A1W1XAS7_9BACT|nr:dissimilatory-type sulfite reductase subunit alpha [Desulfacinum hydrothermale]SMC21135.1 dissimilatory sulfite reductase alpha subunit [Desulfacinum hydrothermale DSM 13146]